MPKTQDLTKGKVSKVLFFFSLPLVLTNFLQTIHLMLDVLMVGRAMGTNAMSAVALVDRAFYF